MTVTSGQNIPHSFSSAQGVAGGTFLLLALFAGILGGVMALPFFHMQNSSGMVVSHAVLMTFYVVCPAFLGGMAQWFLPQALGTGTQYMALPTWSRVACVILVLGVIQLPYFPMLGLVFWGVGMIALAVNVIATILEMRSIAFRALPPVVWAFLGNASSLIIVAPVFLALIVKSSVAGGEGVSLLHIIQWPQIDLLCVPALGLITGILLSHSSDKRGITFKVAPYVFGVMGFVPSLVWCDTLFGGMPQEYLNSVMWAVEVIPGLCLLISVLIDVWKRSVVFEASIMWSLGAIILMAIGWLGEVLPVHWFEGDLLGRQVSAHQAIVFGSLMALSGAFYVWFTYYGTLRRHVIKIWGMLHACVTFLGAVFSLLPFMSLWASLLMGISLAGFIIMGAYAWYGLLLKRFGISETVPYGG